MKTAPIALTLVWIGVLVLTVAVPGCSPEDASTGDEIAYYEEAKIITEEEAGNIIEVTENRTRILFSETTAFVAGIEPGDILVSERPVPGAAYGLLERVTGVSDDGNVVEVEPVTLEDVIERGVISITTLIPQGDLLSTATWATGTDVLQIGGAHQFSCSPAEGVTVEGYLLATADAEVYIEASFWNGLEEFEFTFSPGLEIEVTLQVQQGAAWNERYTIATIPGPPIPIWGPVTITPNVELVVGASGAVDASLEGTVAYERSYDVGFRYYRGSWETISEVHGEGSTLEPPSFNGQAIAQVFGGTVFSGTAGVSYVAEATLGAELLGNVQASGEMERSPWRWQYDLGLYISARVLGDLDLCRIAHVSWESDPWEYPDPPYNLAYGASGRVTTEGGHGLDGVIVNFSGGHSSVTTNADGYWRKHLLRGEVEVTPEKTGYVFDPASMTAGRSASDLDFRALHEEEGAVFFADVNLEAAVREAIGKPTGDICRSDLDGLTSLDAHERNITDLTGLECCTHLTSLHLGDNLINDISPLTGLTNLTYLILQNNQISDFSPLVTLINLTNLSLALTQMSDIAPLAGLTDLAELVLAYNQINDISPLAGLTRLTSLHLGDNQINDISPLADLTSLTSLSLRNNQISDISPLAKLRDLTWLSLARNQVSDVSPLASLSDLTWLSLMHNQISDISPLAGLIGLAFINLQWNEISDISPLVQNEGLDAGDEIWLESNPLNTDSINVYVPQLVARGVVVTY